jgi:hypothetical protein
VKYEVRDRVKVKNEFDIYKEYRDKQFVIEECDSSDDTYLCHPTTGGYRIWFSEEKLEPVAPTLVEIKENNLRCVIKVDSKEEAVKLFEIFNPNGYDANYDYDYLTVNYRKGDGTVCFSVVGNKINGFDTETSYKKYEEQCGKIYRFSDLFATGSFCDGFRGGKKPEYVLNEKHAKEYADNIIATAESISHITGIPYENSINKLKTCLSAFSNDGISAKNGGKNSMKFTFYTEEGYRIDKSNNSKVETITTFVKINGFDNTYLGMATCDKVDYSEREGVINALANAMCNGNFDREFNKAVKDNARADKKARTCTYCGQLFDTVAEKEAHEAWHVERRKARHERYLLRKRAKEIAFEEQAQKMAKEMIEK